MGTQDFDFSLKFFQSWRFLVPNFVLGGRTFAARPKFRVGQLMSPAPLQRRRRIVPKF